MKLVLAIVNNDDSTSVISALTAEKFQVTKLATTGGFLKTGNTTLITGVEDNKANKAVEIISEYSSKRTQLVPINTAVELGNYSSSLMEIAIGGASIFVLDVDRYEKV